MAAVLHLVVMAILSVSAAYRETSSSTTTTSSNSSTSTSSSTSSTSSTTTTHIDTPAHRAVCDDDVRDPAAQVVLRVWEVGVECIDKFKLVEVLDDNIAWAVWCLARAASSSGIGRCPSAAKKSSSGMCLKKNSRWTPGFSPRCARTSRLRLAACAWASLRISGAVVIGTSGVDDSVFDLVLKASTDKRPNGAMSRDTVDGASLALVEAVSCGVVAARADSSLRCCHSPFAFAPAKCMQAALLPGFRWMCRLYVRSAVKVNAAALWISVKSCSGLACESESEMSSANAMYGSASFEPLRLRCRVVVWLKWVHEGRVEM
eukprot:5413311-Amphidinium_carterae.2